MAMNPQFWRGKRVFLTGHTGFKGAWLSLWLQSAGAVVRGYSLAPPTQPSLFEKARVADGMESVLGDIREYSALHGSLAAFAPDVVIHMAAQSLVRLSYVEPLQTYSTNVMGTANILEAVRQAKGVRAVLIVTSDKCYRNENVHGRFQEDAPLGGFDPYSSSKGAAELVTAAYRDSFFSPAKHAQHGTSVASARAGNVIGGGDWAADRLLPDLMRGFARGEAVVLRNPDAIRPWQHVLEPLSGYLLLLERMFANGTEFAQAWNFGPEEADERPVSWVADQAAKEWGTGASWKLDSAPQPHEAPNLRLDCAKVRQHLGWKPRLSLPDALQWTVQWHKSASAGRAPRAMCDEQIRAYQGRAGEASPSPELSLMKGKS
jgi:CDP-glucose 4,6-dehydratase